MGRAARAAAIVAVLLAACGSTARLSKAEYERRLGSIGTSAGTTLSKLFSNPALLTPGQAFELQIEIFPLGHVFRAGHNLLVKVYSPPLLDELYAYDSGQAPAVNTILDDPGHPSSLLAPLLPGLPPIAPTPPACGAQTGVRCVQPAAG